MRIILRVCCLHPRHCALHTHSYPYTPPHSRIQTVSLLRRTNDVPTTCVLRKYEVPYTEAGGSEGSNESGGADGDEELPASVRTASAGLRRTRDSGGPGCSGPSIPAAAVSNSASRVSILSGAVRERPPQLAGSMCDELATEQVRLNRRPLMSTSALACPLPGELAHLARS